MPELAEVEFYRRKWDAGIGAKVSRVHVHGTKRLFRGVDVRALEHALTGAKLVESFGHGKQMTFRFTEGSWLGIHLGMTGELRVEEAGYTPRKHDHLVLFQKGRSLVFTDPRQFGRVHFFQYAAAKKENGEPPWWRDLPPSILSPGFTVGWMTDRLGRHRSLPLKPALLDQSTFAGIGNWMADEILWQAGMNPRTKVRELSPEDLRGLWRTTRSVSKRALATVAKQTTHCDFGDPPRTFLFHARWKRGGKCPRDGTPLRHETIGGRTTAWCPQCQP